MPLDPSLLTALYDNVDRSTYTTASISPTANRWLVIDVALRGTTVTAVSVSGLSLTWVQEAQTGPDVASSLTRFYAWTGASPGSGTLSISLTGGSATGAAWAVYVLGADVDTSDPFVQSAVADDGGVLGTSVSLALGTFGSSSNRPLIALAHAANETSTPEAGYTEIADVAGGSPNQGLAVAFHGSSTDTSPSYSWATSSAYRAIASEIKATAREISFSGSSASSGTVVFTRIRLLSFAGASTSNGTLALAVHTEGVLPFAAAGSSSSTGTVVFHVPHRFLTLAGASTSTGALTFDIFYSYITPLEAASSMSASVRQATPTTPEPVQQSLRINGTGGAVIYAFLDLDLLPTIGVGAQVLHADLRLYKSAPWTSGAKSVTAHIVTESWDSSTITYNTRPDVGATFVTASLDGAGAAGDLIEMDVSDLIQEAVAARDAGSATYFGLRLSTTATDDLSFYSAFMSPDYRPALRIETSVPPSPPENLLPNGGRAVSELKPLLDSRFFDADAEDVISAGQWQVSTDSTFTTTTYDSGEVTVTSAQFDMAAPPSGAAAVSNLTAGTTYYWRDRVRDPHGLWSEYASAAEFTIVLKGILALTYPSSSTVSSPTPTFTFTFTPAGSETQQSVEWDLEVFDAGLWRSHWLSRRTVTSSTSVTLPDAYALEEGRDYRLTVRMWDNVDPPREDMASDRNFLSDSQEFTLQAVSV